MGNINYAQDEMYSARIFYEKSFGIINKISHNSSHKLIADIQGSLGLLNHKTNEFSKSIECYTNAYETYQKLYSTKRHVNIAIILYNHARLLFDMGKTEDSIEKIQQSLSIYNNIYGVYEHIDVVIIVFYLGFLKCRQGDYKSGLEKYQRAFQVYDKTLDINNEEIGFKNLFRYANHYLQKNEFREAEECYFIIMRYRYPILKKAGTRILNISIDKNLNGDASNADNVQDALINACSQGDGKQAISLMANNYASPSGANSDGITPLYAAVQNQHYHMVKLLFSFGNVKINNSKNPIFIASNHDSFETVDYLLHSITSTSVGNKNPLFWQNNTDYSFSLGGGPVVAPAYITKMENILNNFFLGDDELKIQSAEFLISFNEGIFEGIRYLNKNAKMILTKAGIEEIMLTLCTIDSEIIFLLFNACLLEDVEISEFLFEADDNDSSFKHTPRENLTKKLAVSLLKLMGINESFMKMLCAEKPQKLIIKKFTDDKMKSIFIFDVNAYQRRIVDNQSGYSNNFIIIFSEIKKVMHVLSRLSSLGNIDQIKIKQAIEYLSHPYALLRLATKNIIIKLNLLDIFEIIDALIINSQDKNWRIRNESLVILGMCSQPTPDTITCLNKALDDEIIEVRTTAAIVLTTANYSNQKTKDILTCNISGFDSILCLNSIKALTQSSPIDISLMGHLIPCLVSSNTEICSVVEIFIKKMLFNNHEAIFNAIDSFFLQIKFRQNSKELTNILELISSNEKYNHKIFSLLIKLLLLNYDRYYYDPEDDYLLVLLIKFTNSAMVLLNALIDHREHLSLKSLEKIIGIWPEFKNDLFKKIVCEKSIFISLIDSIYKLEASLKIFPQYSKELHELFELHFIDTSSLAIQSLNALINLAKKFPQKKDILLAKTVEDPIWFSIHIRSTQDASSLAVAFQPTAVDNESLVIVQWNNNAPPRSPFKNFLTKLRAKFN